VVDPLVQNTPRRLRSGKETHHVAHPPLAIADHVAMDKPTDQQVMRRPAFAENSVQGREVCTTRTFDLNEQENTGQNAAPDRQELAKKKGDLTITSQTSQLPQQAPALPHVHTTLPPSPTLSENHVNDSYMSLFRKALQPAARAFRDWYSQGANWGVAISLEKGPIDVSHEH
jgi:hypothetical protein